MLRFKFNEKKTRANIASSILQNPDMLRSAYEQVQNAEGSAEIENEKYLDSIDGKIQQLQNRLQELATNVLNSDMFKGLIDGATSLLEVLNNVISTAGMLPVVLGVGSGASLFKNMSSYADQGKALLAKEAVQKRTTSEFGQLGLFLSREGVSSQSKGAWASFIMKNNPEKFTDLESGARFLAGRGVDQKTGTSVLQEVFGNAKEGNQLLYTTENIKAAMSDATKEAAQYGEETSEAAGKIDQTSKGMVATLAKIGPALIGVAAIAGLAIWAQWRDKDYERKAEDFQEKKKDYEDNVQQIEDYNTKISELGSQIDEIKSKGPLTFTQQAELANLQAQKEELEQLRDIQESILEDQKAKAAEAAMTALTAEEGTVNLGRGTKQMVATNGKYTTTYKKTDIVSAQRDEAAALLEGEKKLQEYRNQLESARNEAERKGAEKRVKDQEDENRKLKESLGDRASALKEYQNSLRLTNEDEAQMYTDIQQALNNTNVAISDSKAPIDLMRKNIDAAFTSTDKDINESRQKLKDYLVDAVSNGKTANQALAEIGLTAKDINLADISDGSGGVISAVDSLNSYFNDLKKTADDTKEAIKETLSVDGTFEGVKAAQESENAGKNWEDVSGWLKTGKESYEKGLVGTDDFQTLAQFMSPKKIDTKGFKYASDAYVKAWKDAQDKVKKYFDSENPFDSMKNFQEDAVDADIMKWVDEDEGETKNLFKSTADAAKAMGLSVQATEVILNRLKDYGFEFDGIEWSSEKLDEYRQNLENLQGVYNEMREGEERDRLGNMLKSFNGQYEHYQDNLSDLKEDVIVNIKFEYDFQSLLNEINNLKKGLENGWDLQKGSDLIVAQMNAIEKAEEQTGVKSMKYVDSAIKDINEKLQSTEVAENPALQQQLQQVKSELLNLPLEFQNELLAGNKISWDEFLKGNIDEVLQGIVNDDVRGEVQKALDGLKPTKGSDKKRKSKYTQDLLVGYTADEQRKYYNEHKDEMTESERDAYVKQFKKKYDKKDKEGKTTTEAGLNKNGNLVTDIEKSDKKIDAQNKKLFDRFNKLTESGKKAKDTFKEIQEAAEKQGIPVSELAQKYDVNSEALGKYIKAQEKAKKSTKDLTDETGKLDPKKLNKKLGTLENGQKLTYKATVDGKETEVHANKDETTGVVTYTTPATDHGHTYEKELRPVVDLEGSIVYTSVDTNPVSNEIKQITNEDGTVTYKADVGGVEQEVQEVADEDGNITYQVKDENGEFQEVRAILDDNNENIIKFEVPEEEGLISTWKEFKTEFDEFDKRQLGRKTLEIDIQFTDIPDFLREMFPGLFPGGKGSGGSDDNNDNPPPSGRGNSKKDDNNPPPSGRGHKDDDNPPDGPPPGGSSGRGQGLDYRPGYQKLSSNNPDYNKYNGVTSRSFSSDYSKYGVTPPNKLPVTLLKGSYGYYGVDLPNKSSDKGTYDYYGVTSANSKDLGLFNGDNSIQNFLKGIFGASFTPSDLKSDASQILPDNLMQNIQSKATDLWNMFTQGKISGSEFQEQLSKASNLVGIFGDSQRKAAEATDKNTTKTKNLSDKLTSLGAGESTAFDTKVDNQETQVTATKDEEGVIHYTADIDGVEQEVEPILDEDGNVVYTSQGIPEIEGDLEKVVNEDGTVTYVANADGVETTITPYLTADGQVVYKAEDSEVQSKIHEIENDQHEVKFKFEQIGNINDQQSKQPKTIEQKTKVTADTSKASGAVAQIVNQKIPDKPFTIKAIGASAARNAVNSVRSAVNSLPASKTVTLRTIKETVIKKKVVPSGGGGLHGSTGLLSGTAHASGTPSWIHGLPKGYEDTPVSTDNYPSKWQTRTDEEALVGEVGQEMVVHGDRWWLVGEGGPEFTHIPAHSVVFNSKQTEELLNAGATKTRGTAHVSGTTYDDGTAFDPFGFGFYEDYDEDDEEMAAFAHGTAFGNGGRLKKNDSSSSSSSSSSRSSSSGKGNKTGGNKGKSKKKKSGSSGDKNFEEAKKKAEKFWEKFEKWAAKFFDWIEIRLNRLKDVTEKWSTAAEKAVQAGSNEQAEYYKKAIEAVKAEMGDSGKATGKYEAQAKKVGNEGAKKYNKYAKEYNKGVDKYNKKLSKKDRKKKGKKEKPKLKKGWVDQIYNQIANGKMNISRYNEQQQTIIKDMQQWYDKSLEASKAVRDLTDNLQDLCTSLMNIPNVKADEAVEKINKQLENLSSDTDRAFQYENTSLAANRERLQQQTDKAKEIENERAGARNTAQDQLNNAINEASKYIAVDGVNKVELNDDWSQDQKEAVANYNGAIDALKTANDNFIEAENSYWDAFYENAAKMLESITQYYEKRIAEHSARAEEVESYVALTKSEGAIYGSGSDVFNGERQSKQQAKDLAKKEYEDYVAEYNAQLNAGILKVGSQQYYEAQAQLANLRKSYYDSAKACRDFNEALRDLDFENIENEIKRLSSVLSRFSSRRDLAEKIGNKTLPRYSQFQMQESDYAQEITTNLSLIDKAYEKYAEALKDQEQYQVNSEPWIKAHDRVEEAASAVMEYAGNIEEASDAIRELRWKAFEEGIKQLERITSELETIQSLLNEDNFISKENGFITNEGLASITLMGEAIHNNSGQIDVYKKALKKLREELDNGMISQDEFNDKTQEYQDKINELAKTNEDYRKNILEQYFSSLERQNELLEEQIDLRSSALEKMKSFYDYQKTITSKSRDINYLRQQIAALQGVKIKFCAYSFNCWKPLRVS